MMKIGPATQGVLWGIALCAVGGSLMFAIYQLLEWLDLGPLGAATLMLGGPIGLLIVAALIVDNRKRRPGC